MKSVYKNIVQFVSAKLIPKKEGAKIKLSGFWKEILSLNNAKNAFLSYKELKGVITWFVLVGMNFAIIVGVIGIMATMNVLL